MTLLYLGLLRYSQYLLIQVVTRRFVNTNSKILICDKSMAEFIVFKYVISRICTIHSLS